MAFSQVGIAVNLCAKEQRTKFVVAIFPHCWTLDAEVFDFVPLKFIQFS